MPALTLKTQNPILRAESDSAGRIQPDSAFLMSMLAYIILIVYMPALTSKTQNRIGFCPQNQIVSELPNRVNSMLGLMVMIQLNSAGGSRIECIVIVTVD